MKLTPPAKLRAHEIMVDDWIKIGGKLFRVRTIHPGYCDHNKLSFTLMDPDDTIGPDAVLLINRHIKLKVYKQK